MYEISGDIVFADNCPQNKALQRIMYDGTMALRYNSTNIKQRHVMMVLFYGLAGENWKQNEGFGSNKDKCE